MSDGQNPADWSEEQIREWLRDREENPDVSDLSREMLSAFGGAKGLATEARKTYDLAPEGGQTRALLLKASIELVKNATPKEGKPDPLANMKPDQIKELIAGLNRMKRENEGGGEHG